MKKQEEQLIKSRQRVRKFAEVYTPAWLVKDMVDMVYNNSPELQTDRSFIISSTWLEPACGNGNFLEEILRRKLDACQTQAEAHTALASVFGIDIQEDNIIESRERLQRVFSEYFEPSLKMYTTLQRNIVAGNMLTARMNTGEDIWFLAEYADQLREVSQKKGGRKK